MKKLIGVLMLGIIVLLAACGDKEEDVSSNQDPQLEDIQMEEDEIVAKDEVVVTINDTNITGEIYNAIYMQTKIHAYQLGQDLEDKENLKEITIQEIIAQELIKQDANKQGIEVTEESVNEEYEQIKSQTGEQFAENLKQLQLTEKSLKYRILFKQTLEPYVEKEISIEEVTEEDIKETYDTLKEDMENIMEFEDAKPMIKERLTQIRQSEALKVKIEELEETADIETHI